VQEGETFSIYSRVHSSIQEGGGAVESELLNVLFMHRLQRSFSFLQSANSASESRGGGGHVRLDHVHVGRSGLNDLMSSAGPTDERVMRGARPQRNSPAATARSAAWAAAAAAAAANETNEGVPRSRARARSFLRSL